MIIFFASALDSQGGPLILPTINSLQYKFAYPNPTPLLIAIRSTYQANHPATAPSAPALSPAAATAPTNT